MLCSKTTFSRAVKRSPVLSRRAYWGIQGIMVMSKWESLKSTRRKSKCSSKSRKNTWWRTRNLKRRSTRLGRKCNCKRSWIPALRRPSMSFQETLAEEEEQRSSKQFRVDLAWNWSPKKKSTKRKRGWPRKNNAKLMFHMIMNSLTSSTTNTTITKGTCGKKIKLEGRKSSWGKSSRRGRLESFLYTERHAIALVQPGRRERTLMRTI